MSRLDEPMAEAARSRRPGGKDSEPEAPLTVIRPTRGWLPLDLREVWRYRELLVQLAWRNTTVRYKQSVVGVGWALIKPVVSMVVFNLVFNKMARLSTEGIPGPIFYYSGLLPWLYFSGCLTAASQSLVGGRNMVTKVYFPRLVLPMSYLFGGLVDFGVQIFVLAGMMAWWHARITVTWAACWAPAFILLAMAASMAFSLWLTALMVKYRDVGHALPFLVQIGMFLTPVVYAGAKVPQHWRMVYALNPMAAAVQGFRWSLTGVDRPDALALAVGCAMTLAVLIGGLYFFRRTERTFADII